MLFFYKWADSKIPEKEIPRLILNIALDWFIAGNEGLTIFSPSGSFADPSFGYLYLWLRRKVNKGLLSPQPGIPDFAEKLITDMEPPFEGTNLGDYFLHATELYLTRNKDLKNLAPMIIFPDRTYYSPGL